MLKIAKPIQAKDVIGKLTPPPSIVTQPSDLGRFLSTVIRVLLVVAGIYALIQMLIGGFTIITAAGDQEKMRNAQQQITNALIGLLVMVGVFIVTAIISKLLFGSYTYILNPQLQTVSPSGPYQP